MARNALISEKRFKQIIKRQEQVKWLADYEPAMLATRDEAPKISRPSTMYCARLDRDLHFMSLAERHVCLLALYHPRVFDIHEQHMLHPFEAPHPLANHPEAFGLALSPVQGTVTIAEQLGILSKHPVVLLTDPDNPADSIRHAFPYLGDLLLFLKDDQGQYCVNWSVKASREDFYAQPQKAPSREASTLANTKRLLNTRHLLEQQYFNDAKIPTHFIASENLNLHLVHNLNSLCAKAQGQPTVSYEVEEELTHKLQNIVDTQTTVLSLLATWSAQFKCDRADLISIFYRSVWNRRVRLDLYRPILVDKPLRAERTDVLLDHAHFFGR